MKLINIIGANATGKSVRTWYLIKYINSIHSYTDFKYNTRRKGYIVIGRFYKDIGLLIIGKETKNGWVSLDSADLSSYEDKLSFYKEMSERGDIKTILQEGYFNNRSAQGSPNNLRNWGVDSSEMYFLYYDTVEQFLDRTNNRSGRTDRTLEWASNCPGWRDNAVVQQTEVNYRANCSEMDKIERVGINESKTYFIKQMFGVDVDPLTLVTEPVKSVTAFDTLF